MQRIFQLAVLVRSAAWAVSPRPSRDLKASYARWLVHESDYGTVFTHHDITEVFGNIISVADGNNTMDSTGTVITFLPSLDATYHDLMQNSRVSVTFTEKALPGGLCSNTAEDLSCGRVTMNGYLTKVPGGKKHEASSVFKKRHPQGWLWDFTHGFEPFWLAPENITEILLSDDFDLTHRIEVPEFLAAPWYGPPVPTPSPLPAPALHSRPWIWQKPSLARWLVHESDFAVVGTHSKGTELLGSILSISDGEGAEASTGIIYALLSTSDTTYKNLIADSRASLTWSEKALANGNAPGCLWGTGESPPCVRLTMLGSLTPVPEANKSVALKFLYARHPEMKSWTSKGDLVPFWMAPENITEFFLIPFYGGAEHFSVKAYLEAPWYSGGPSPAPMPVPPPSPDKLACSQCGHVYSPEADGGGKAFEDLPDAWTCPVCGAAKSAFQKISLADGSSTWVHEETTVVV